MKQQIKFFETASYAAIDLIGIRIGFNLYLEMLFAVVVSSIHS
jgi:hypothetical protein